METMKYKQYLLENIIMIKMIKSFCWMINKKNIYMNNFD